VLAITEMVAAGEKPKATLVAARLGVSIRHAQRLIAEAGALPAKTASGGRMNSGLQRTLGPSEGRWMDGACGHKGEAYSGEFDPAVFEAQLRRSAPA
jgi:hypothetical protein